MIRLIRKGSALFMKFVMEIENFEYILCRFYCIIFFMFVNKKVNEK